MLESTQSRENHGRGDNRQQPSRRGFLQSSTATIVGGALAGSLAIGRSAHAAGSDALKVGLIGCGGRGTGAAAQALGADPNVKLVAMATRLPIGSTAA